MNFKIVKYFLLLSIIFSYSCGVSEGKEEAVSFKPFSYTFTIYDVPVKMDSNTFVSKVTNEKIRLDVSYIKGEKPVKYMPVLYLTDGHWRRIDHKYIHYLSYLNVIPSVLVVGVGYSSEYDDPMIQRTRTRDLHERPDNFIKVFKEEIFPYVEKRYSCDPDKRILYGVSYGGYFTSYTFLHNARRNDQMFIGYIGGSPYLNKYNLVGSVDGLPDEAKTFKSKLFLAYGEKDFGAQNEIEMYHLQNENLYKKIELFGFKNVLFKHYEYPDKNHYTITRASLIDGVRFILGDYDTFNPSFLHDLDFASLSYDFSSTTQVYDWEPYNACKSVALNNDDKFSNNGRGSLQVKVNFKDQKEGGIATVFEKAADLTYSKLVMHIYVPKGMDYSKYKWHFFVQSTPHWKMDIGKQLSITRHGWNKLTYKFSNKKMEGDLEQVRRLGLMLIPKTAQTWNGELYIDDISFN